VTGQPVAPPATIGMLGGGQLGRYAIVAARLAGYGTVVLDPDPSAPAGRVADRHLVAPYDDPTALDVLAATCAVVTTEFENPPAAALDRLAADVTVAPPPAAVAIAQDRIAEKTFLAAHHFATAPWAPLVNDIDIAAASSIGVPAIVKTARLGYDGKGQHAVDATATVATVWQALGGVPCVVERRVPLDVEVSAIVARSASGDTVVYPIAENEHRDGILDVTIVPARVDERLASEAATLAVAVADALDYVGVLAVEMFVSGGRLLVNELAPRPHNSGHWTLDGAHTDQFAQQVRAVTGSALGDPSMTAPAAAMVNLLGDLWFPVPGSEPIEPDWAVALADASAHLHLYGKREARPGRKMGHLTVLGTDATDAAESARSLQDRLRRT
jgi:5-(carboxyamino)imidazole ribonucleotide synthase